MFVDRSANLANIRWIGTLAMNIVSPINCRLVSCSTNWIKITVWDIELKSASDAQGIYFTINNTY